LQPAERVARPACDGLAARSLVMASSVARLNRAELAGGGGGGASWHHDFRDTAWVYVGGLSGELCEGDVLCVLSQFGEVEDFHLVRDGVTGESKGFAYLKYEDWRSTVLAVDNLNGARLLGNALRVSHTRYERPKKKKAEEDAMTEEDLRAAMAPGHAYVGVELENEYSLENGYDVFAERRKVAASAAAEGPAPGFLKRPRTAMDALRSGPGSDEDDDDKARKARKGNKSGKRGKGSKGSKADKADKAEKEAAETTGGQVARRDKKRKREKESKRSRDTSGNEAERPRKSEMRAPAPPSVETDAERRRRLAALSAMPAAAWDAAL
jgi:RNA-binding motif X-linked protein 2